MTAPINSKVPIAAQGASIDIQQLPTAILRNIQTYLPQETVRATRLRVCLNWIIPLNYLYKILRP